MTPCVYCIGCKWYRRDEKQYCACGEECASRSRWEPEEAEA